MPAAPALPIMIATVLTRQLELGVGEGSQNEPTLHFGLGLFAGPVNLEIQW